MDSTLMHTLPPGAIIQMPDDYGLFLWAGDGEFLVMPHGDQPFDMEARLTTTTTEKKTGSVDTPPELTTSIPATTTITTQRFVGAVDDAPSAENGLTD
jgi:hypothetical protein